MLNFLAQTSFDDAFRDIWDKATTTRSVLILIVTFLVAYVVSALTAKIVVKLAQAIAVRSDTASTEERAIRLRRVETYLSVGIAVLRAVIIGAAIYIALSIILPERGALVTSIGVGTFFIVIANATIAPLLRDFTSGAVMIVERWFSVGDFVRVEPFLEVGGVVERVTLRSTKLRDLNGETIWLHNQYIQGVKVTPRGVRTMAVDVFVRKPDEAEEILNEVAKTLPTGPTMLVRPLAIQEKEKLGDDLWRITMMAQTAPGREWLIEDFLAPALKDADKAKGDERIIIYGPLVRYADELAEKRFRRAVRVGNKLRAG
jgi:small-conductance mechanosensitive channel